MNDFHQPLPYRLLWILAFILVFTACLGLSHLLIATVDGRTRGLVCVALTIILTPRFGQVMTEKGKKFALRWPLFNKIIPF